jgi:hypothetical protein
MLGKNVVVPVSLGSEVEGIVEKFDPDTGALVIKDEDGNFYRGYEHQVSIID